MTIFRFIYSCTVGILSAALLFAFGIDLFTDPILFLVSATILNIIGQAFYTAVVD